MVVRISSTEAARSFGDCLARIKHTGDTFMICKNDRPIAVLSPAPGKDKATVRDFLDAWQPDESDPSFAADLDSVNRQDAVFANPWASSSTPRP